MNLFYRVFLTKSSLLLNEIDFNVNLSVRQNLCIKSTFFGYRLKANNSFIVLVLLIYPLCH